MANHDEQDLGEMDDEDNNEDSSLLGPVKTSRELLPRALIENAIGMEGIGDLSSREGCCAVVIAPAADWVQPLYKCLRVMGDWTFYHCRSAAPRSRSAQDDSSLIDQAVSAMAGGHRALGVSHRTDLLPGPLVAGADIKLVLPMPNKRVVAAVIRAVTEEAPDDFDEGIFDKLGFDELASCIRRGSTPAQCIERMRQATELKRVDPSTVATPEIGDLHGYGAAKDWALNLMADLDAWRRGEIPFDAIDRNVVLASPPGMGKTTFARSLAKSTGLPLVPTSVAEWFLNGAGYLDSVIKQIDSVFSTARSMAPAIVFLDEIEAVPNRATLSRRNSDWWLPVVGHLLTTLDGAVSDKSQNLIVIGATNFAERLDAALIRPGRLSRVIEIGLPDEASLAGILRQHLGTELAEEDLALSARSAVGMTGADIAERVKRARGAARRQSRPMALQDLLDAITPLDDRDPASLRRVAIHEAGHAIAAHIGGELVQSVSIVPSGDRGGLTKVRTADDMSTREHVEGRVLHLLAGRAAEEVVLGHAGTGAGGGAGSDLAMATQMIGALHTTLGLGRSLIYRADVEDVPKVLSFDRDLSALVEEDLARLYSQAMEVVRTHLGRIESVVDELLAKRIVGRDRFLEIVGGSGNGPEA